MPVLFFLCAFYCGLRQPHSQGRASARLRQPHESRWCKDGIERPRGEPPIRAHAPPDRHRLPPRAPRLWHLHQAHALRRAAVAIAWGCPCRGQRSKIAPVPISPSGRTNRSRPSFPPRGTCRRFLPRQRESGAKSLPSLISFKTRYSTHRFCGRALFLYRARKNLPRCYRVFAFDKYSSQVSEAAG